MSKQPVVGIVLLLLVLLGFCWLNNHLSNHQVTNRAEHNVEVQAQRQR
jgi:hypothetical protein